VYTDQLGDKEELRELLMYCPEREMFYKRRNIGEMSHKKLYLCGLWENHESATIEI